MIPQVKEDILNVIKESLIAIKENDAVKLRDLSNQTLHSSSIFQDENAISIAIVCYALSKVFERTQYKGYGDWDIFYNTCSNNLKNAQVYLEKDDLANYQISIKNILNVIEKLSSNLRRYVKEVIEQAQVAKGSRLYEHGLSIGKTAELLGINKWELMEYAGRTGISDVQENITISMKDRIKFVRGLFT